MKTAALGSGDSTRKNDVTVHKATSRGARHMRSEFQAAIAQLIAEKGLPREVVMETVATALLSAYRKSYGGGENIRIEVDKNREVHVWAAKRVVAQVTVPGDEVSLAEAQRIDRPPGLGRTIVAV